MTSPSAEPTGSSNPSPVHPAQADTGHFMLTLCRLAAPVFIRPLQAPQLRSYTFFMSRARQADGSERLYLHMGYFATLAEAERWGEAVRRHYPNAFATIAPAAFLRRTNSDASLVSGAQPVALLSGDPAPVRDASLTDTQVLRILERRRVSRAHDDVDEGNFDQVSLLRPDDTGTRQALKEAVVQGAPVSFAVQLHWSEEPIDLSRVPSLAVFKAHTLYATESHREGHSRNFLRLGFFADPISAKQVAVQVRSNFAAAAVVPVVEPEITRAREAGMGTSVIPYLGEHRVDQGSDSGAPGSPTPSQPSSERRISRGARSGKQTHGPADKKMRTDSDPLSESGVRHLRVEVQEQLSGRWKIIRLAPTEPDLAQISS